MINQVISHKVNFKTRSIVRSKEKHVTMIKRFIHWEHIVLNVYVSQNFKVMKPNDRNKKPNRKSTQSELMVVMIPSQ